MKPFWEHKAFMDQIVNLKHDPSCPQVQANGNAFKMRSWVLHDRPLPCTCDVKPMVKHILLQMQRHADPIEMKGKRKRRDERCR